VLLPAVQARAGNCLHGLVCQQRLAKFVSSCMQQRQ
jgi:hypothetical protein